MKRWLKWLLWSLLAASVLTGGAVTVVSTTQWGLRWVADRLGGVLPGQLNIASLHGRLIGPIRIKGLTYHGQAEDLKIDSVTLNWRPSALLAGTMHVTRFELAGVRYSQTGAPAAASSAHAAAAPPAVSLPVAVRLEDFSIEGLTVIRRGGAPVHVDRIRLAARTANGSIRISRLTVSAPRYDVSARGSLRPRGAYPMKWHTRWTVRPAGMNPFSGTLDLTGSLTSLDVTQQIRNPVRIDLEGHVDNVMTRPAWRARIDLRQVKAREIRPAFPALEVDGDLHLEGGPDSAAAKGRLSIKTRLRDTSLPVDSRFQIAYRNQDLTIDRLNLRIPGRPAEADITGRVTGLTGARRADLKGTWTHLSWPPAAKGEAALISDSGQVHVTGSLDDYALTGRAELSAKRLARATVRIEAAGNRQAVTISKMQVQALQGTVSARGTLAWRPRPAWRLQLNGSDLNPGAVDPDYPGRIDFTAAVSGSRSEQGLSATLDLQRLQGKLRGYPIRAGTRMRLAGSQLDIQDLSVTSGKTSVSASGRVGKTWDVTWRIASPDIHALYPQAHGALSGHGRLEGLLRRPAVKAALSGSRLAFGGYALERIDGNVDVDTARAGPFTVQLKAFGLRIKKRHLAFVHLSADGTLSDHRLRGAVHTDAGVLSVALAGGYRDGQWTGTVDQLELIGRIPGYWHLNRPVPVSVGRDRVRIEHLCWERKDARLCGHGQWQRGADWLADLELEGFELQWLKPLFSFDAGVAGTVSARMTARRKDGRVSGQGRMNLKQGVAETKLPDGTPIAVNITQAALQATTQGRNIQATLTVSTDQGGNLDGEIAIPLASLPGVGPSGAAPPPIKGHVTARLTNLKILPRLVPTVQNTHGILKATLEIGGTLARPELAGTMALDKGEMDIPGIGIHVTDATVSAKSPDGRHFSLTGSARSGGGDIHIDAGGPLPFGDYQAITIKITSKEFEMVRIPEAQALATSDITVKVSATSLEFSGSVTIPRARLQPRDVSGAVHASDDVTVVNSPVQAGASTARRVSGSIEVNFGRNVSIKGYGLKGQVTGTVTVKEQPKQPTLGYGNLDITGKYKAYGQNLDIQQGRLSFVGSPIENPGLNIRAVRTTGDVTAGIHVTGTLQTPRVALFSNPAMDDANVLSYLLLGRPINQASTKQGNTLSNAATSLGLSGGEFLAKKIGHMFGIEDVKVESTNGNQTAALVLGKYLTPDLYISYGFGLLQPLNILQLRYQISKHWELKAESGLYNGGDILYTIDTH